jgi:hypothetical protein
MKVLTYNHLDTKKIPNFKKIKTFLEKDDFKSAEVKKIGDNFYRARLDQANRLLFSIYHHQGQAYALILEYIANHAYDKSRFLKGGADIDENKIPLLTELTENEGKALVYVNPNNSLFHLLDKIISFDETQVGIYHIHPPVIIIGSAGSGKTALTLEKMKQQIGDVLYVTRSPYLVHNSRNLYYALNYENEHQHVDFLSFEEYLSSIQVPQGRELTFREFAQWFSRFRTPSGIKDAHQLFEEFKGVLTGPSTNKPYLFRQEYLNLGVKQSIFSQAEREKVYDLFEKYLAYMKDNNYYDANILSWEYLHKVTPTYNFVVVDEVQDLTNIQLQIILKSLHHPNQFILCGDSNQIVHPNFFSWSKLKSFFYQQEAHETPSELIRILNTNYRNSPEITEVANRILKLKTARFGSIDKESNYLVRSNAHNQGVVLLLNDDAKLTRELNHKTRQSTRFAVIVMHPDEKVRARQHFQTPLVFSIQEAKGLEYDNIILYNFTSNDEERFKEICRGVTHEDLVGELHYARTKDKSDKSLEIYKFHINALYVAVTRAVKNIYMVESHPKQSLFDLLGLKLWQSTLSLAQQGSSLEEWREEARKLELQGKQEQAEEIRTQILKLKSVPWDILVGDKLQELEHKALEKGDKKAKLLLFEYSLVYSDQPRMNALSKVGFMPAKHPEHGIKSLNQKYFLPYELKNITAIVRQVEQYGVDFRNPFNQTPLMISARLGNEPLMAHLLEIGADSEKINNVGLNSFQIALEQACQNKTYAAKKLSGVYINLEPDNMVIQVDGRLVKLDKSLMEFLMLNLMISMFYTRLGNNLINHISGFSSSDFVEVLSHFPNSIVPERRKQRAYISSILSKNELGREEKYNRKLFYRIKRGNYVINPKLSVRIGDEWRPIYQLLSLDLIEYVAEEIKNVSADRLFIEQKYDEIIESFRQQLRDYGT